MFWAFMFFMAVAGMLMTIGHYERRIDAMNANPRVRVKLVPRTMYEEQTGVDWVSTS